MMEELADYLPAAKAVLIDERDQYLATRIRSYKVNQLIRTKWKETRCWTVVLSAYRIKDLLNILFMLAGIHSVCFAVTLS